MRQWVIPRSPPGQPPGRTDFAGKALNLKGVQWGSSRLTVVVAMQTHCHYCEESIPFYRRLAEAAASSKARIGLVFCSYETPDLVTGWLSRGRVGTALVTQTSFKEIGIGGTPTLFMVDSAGVVKKAYFGRLSPADEDELMRVLAS